MGKKRRQQHKEMRGWAFRRVLLELDDTSLARLDRVVPLRP
jgi:hypothetical protein